MQGGENSETEGGSARKRAALEGVAGLISPQGMAILALRHRLGQAFDVLPDNLGNDFPCVLANKPDRDYGHTVEMIRITSGLLNDATQMER